MNLKLEWFQLKSRRALRITIIGHLDENSANVLANDLKKELDKNDSGKITLVWNCLDMTGYEPVARMKIQNLIKSFKNQLENNYLVSTNKVIQGGAKILSIFSSFNMKVVNSEDEIK